MTSVVRYNPLFIHGLRHGIEVRVRAIHRLSALAVKRADRPGYLPDGGGLYLRGTKSGTGSWVFRYERDGQRRELGLGGVLFVNLAEARKKAAELRHQIGAGETPSGVRAQARQHALTRRTFEWCAEQTIAAKRPEWKSAKHAEQWITTLRDYAFPVIGTMPVDDVELAHIKAILAPIWNAKTETATRLRARLEAVLSWAAAAGYRDRERPNPARWKGNLDALLPKPSKIAKVTHHAALAIDAMPSFMEALRQREGMAARALEFVVLTAARSGEVRGATWDEIDLSAKIWTIPAERMKAGKEHRVPITPAALAVLKKVIPLKLQAGFTVFPAKKGGELSDMALTEVMRRMDAPAVPHGFRSTFRDWASERTNYPREVAEMALAHAISNKVEAAYRRGDLFQKRIEMMQDWADFVG